MDSGLPESESVSLSLNSPLFKSVSKVASLRELSDTSSSAAFSKSLL